jgi:hypothetical protein
MARHGTSDAGRSWQCTDGHGCPPRQVPPRLRLDRYKSDNRSSVTGAAPQWMTIGALTPVGHLNLMEAGNLGQCG